MFSCTIQYICHGHFLKTRGAHSFILKGHMQFWPFDLEKSPEGHSQGYVHKKSHFCTWDTQRFFLRGHMQFWPFDLERSPQGHGVKVKVTGSNHEVRPLAIPFGMLAPFLSLNTNLQSQDTICIEIRWKITHKICHKIFSFQPTQLKFSPMRSLRPIRAF